MNPEISEILKKQHYGIVGRHSTIQICTWTKKSLRDEDFCYKQKFYGISSHRCCQMSPFVACENECLHCWRPIQISKKIKINEIDEPKKIIDECIRQQRKLLSGFKGNKKVNMKKWLEAQEPNQFAISLIGEPTLYPKLAELILELKKREKTSFLVTNGLNPSALLKLEKKNALPTQMYISLNSSNKKDYEKWHKSNKKDAWKLFNKSLEIIKKLKGKTRRVIRITLVKDENMKESDIGGYAELIKKVIPDFVEVKAYMAVGFARKRFGYEKMPFHHEIREYAEKLVKEMKKQGMKKYKILDEKIESRVVLVGEKKAKPKAL